MEKALKLIEWYDEETQSLCANPTIRRYPHYDCCQCVTDIVIRNSTRPEHMRAFLMMGALIDQMMWTHFQDLYPSFLSTFQYPKLEIHGASERMASPEWLAIIRPSHRGQHPREFHFNSAIMDKVLALILSFHRGRHHGEYHFNSVIVDEVSATLLNGLYNWIEAGAIKTDPGTIKKESREKRESKASTIYRILQRHSKPYNLECLNPRFEWIVPIDRRPCKSAAITLGPKTPILSSEDIKRVIFCFQKLLKKEIYYHFGQPVRGKLIQIVKRYDRHF